MNRGDTAYLILNYKVNGQDLVQDGYQEIELQINPQGSFNSVKKLLSDGSISWGTVSYIDDDNVEKSFTGYYAHLSQEETFTLSKGKVNVQLRVMLDNEVGSSAISDINAGNVLSSKVLNATSD